MGDENHCFALAFVKMKQLFLQHFPCLRVHRGKRLIHQQDLRISGECPREADALLHAAAELIGVLVFEAGQSNEVYVVFHSFGKLLARSAGDLESKGDVVHNSFPRQ